MNPRQQEIIDNGNRYLKHIYDDKILYSNQEINDFACRWIKDAAEEYNTLPVSVSFHEKANFIRNEFLSILF